MVSEVLKSKVRSINRMINTGVKFLYECVMGMRKHEGQGCILADEMYVNLATGRFIVRSINSV